MSRSSYVAQEVSVACNTSTQVLHVSPAVPRPNEYSFNKAAGLLVIDQPIGTGYSIAASVDDIPTDMQGEASTCSTAWHVFALTHKHLSQLFCIPLSMAVTLHQHSTVRCAC
jgi:carboxypeptidase C (cathepsin A)